MELFEVKSNKEEVVTFGIRKEYDPIPFGYKPLGAKWTVCWRAYGYKAAGFHVEKWYDFYDHKEPAQVIDEVRKKYGTGKIYGFYEEVITKA